VRYENRNNEWVAIVAIERVQNAQRSLQLNALVRKEKRLAN
jgi:hypothetical protein